MRKKKDIKAVYWLIDQYLSGKIDDNTFCNEFCYTYDLGVDKLQISKLEKEVFSVLSVIAGRFSEFEEDLKLHNAFYNKRELCYAIIETKRSFINQKKMIKNPNDV